MKILFVEDELSKNIPRIIWLFSKYLGKKRVKRLQELESDESGYGAEPEEVKQIVEETNLIEVIYRFPDALHKVIHECQRYSLFIIDRNLVEVEYDFEEVIKIDSTFTESQYDRYFEREGDYLLYKLAFQKVAVKNNFYYLTAYAVHDEIRGCDDLQTLIEHFGNFKTENFIEKGSDKDFERLLNVIENIPILNLQHENSTYLNILRKNINSETEDWFLEILQDKDKPERIKTTLTLIRNVYEAILNTCSKNIPDMEVICKDQHGKLNQGKKTIDWLTTKGHINSIQRNFFFSINIICSDFGPHNPKEGYQPSSNTVNSLVYALKDIILWFDQICRR